MFWGITCLTQGCVSPDPLHSHHLACKYTKEYVGLRVVSQGLEPTLELASPSLFPIVQEKFCCCSNLSALLFLTLVCITDGGGGHLGMHMRLLTLPLACLLTPLFGQVIWTMCVYMARCPGKNFGHSLISLKRGNDLYLTNVHLW